MSTTPYQELVQQIIQKQATVLGLSIAIRRARAVPGFKIEDDSTVTEVPADPVPAIESLVEQYKILSGNIGVDFCKQVASSWHAAHAGERLPSILQ